MKKLLLALSILSIHSVSAYEYKISSANKYHTAPPVIIEEEPKQPSVIGDAIGTHIGYVVGGTVGAVAGVLEGLAGGIVKGVDRTF